MTHIGVRKKSSITTWNRWKKEGNSKVSKKNKSTIVVCVCVEFDTPEEFKVQMEWVPQNNRSIQAKWKWNNLLVRLVILLHAIAIKTCYKQLKINNTVYWSQSPVYSDESYRRKLLFWQLANSKRGLFCWYYCSVMLCSCLVKKAIFCFPARSKFLTDLLPIFQQLKTAKKRPPKSLCVSTELFISIDYQMSFLDRASNSKLPASNKRHFVEIFCMHF